MKSLRKQSVEKSPSASEICFANLTRTLIIGPGCKGASELLENHICEWSLTLRGWRLSSGYRRVNEGQSSWKTLSLKVGASALLLDSSQGKIVLAAAMLPSDNQHIPPPSAPFFSQFLATTRDLYSLPKIRFYEIHQHDNPSCAYTQFFNNTPLAVRHKSGNNIILINGKNRFLISIPEGHFEQHDNPLRKTNIRRMIF